MSNSHDRASVVVVTHNSEDHIRRSLESLRAAGPDDEIIVVDNASTDETLAVLADFPVAVVRLDSNEGFAAGCHHGVDTATHELLLFVTPDVQVRPGWVGPLQHALEKQGVGAAVATLELPGEPGRLNSAGGEMTYFGLAWANEIRSTSEPEGELVEIPFAPGAALAIKRATWEELDGFRKDFGTYYEDVDFGWRMNMAGLRAVRATSSRVVHDYDFSRHPEKLFQLERNRLNSLATNYRRSTRLLLLPALGLVEVGLLLVALRDGWLKAKVRSWRAAWAMRSENADWRRRVQASRVVGDAQLLANRSSHVTGISQIALPPGAGFVGKLLGGYLRLVLPIVRSVDRRLGLS